MFHKKNNFETTQIIILMLQLGDDLGPDRAVENLLEEEVKNFTIEDLI